MAMRKLCLVVFIMLTLAMAVPAMAAVTWMPMTQGTITWDAVTLLKGGGAVPTEDTVKYNIYIRREGAGIVTLYSTVEAIQETITFPSEGKWLTGVQSVRVVDGEEVYSDAVEDITWSDSTDTARVAVPFGFVLYEPLAGVAGLRPQTP